MDPTRHFAKSTEFLSRKDHINKYNSPAITLTIDTDV